MGFFFSCVERALVYCAIFSVWWTRLGILCFIFLYVEHALLFCVVYLCVCNALWYFLLYIPPCGKRSGIFCSVILCYIYHQWNSLWYFVTYNFPHAELATCILCYIFSASLFIFCRIILTLLSFLFSFLTIWKYCWFTCSVIGESRVVFFSVWNALWYCVISCYIFLRVERALVLWNLVLCFSACVVLKFFACLK